MVIIIVVSMSWWFLTLEISACAKGSTMAGDDAHEEAVVLVKGLPYFCYLAAGGLVDAVELVGAGERY